ncbi:hypothetical protein CDAR_41031 [Caerostris darwini]|uniref:Uncharacterized protein n=1 Tax=Caerostris darwini TaxID=1538125 RepID=A0AAV4VFY9_9ARAC|nr:hypothetical protein CDAR_41031 [Caerostris darwini]
MVTLAHARWTVAHDRDPNGSIWPGHPFCRDCQMTQKSNISGAKYSVQTMGGGRVNIRTRCERSLESLRSRHCGSRLCMKF